MRKCPPGSEESDRSGESARVGGTPQVSLIELRNLAGQVFRTVENGFDDLYLGRLSAVKGGYEIGPTLHIGRPTEKPLVQKIHISAVGSHRLDGI